MSFHDLRLSEPLVRAVVEDGYASPTPIQARAIPVVLSGKDVLGCAQTGTGKTCAFALPILHHLSEGKGKKGPAERKRGRGTPPRALVLCPTRELATQIYDSFAGYGRNVRLRYTVIYGGVSQGRQVRDLRGGVDVVVATPGRLLDLVNQGHVDLSAIEVFVLDEADRMLDMGFIPDIRKVVRMIPKHRQTLFFSATMSKEIRKLADAILVDPVSIETERESSTVESIDQRVYMIERKRKSGLLEHLLRTEEMARTLVFTRTKYGADKLAKYLCRGGIGADAIHGNKSQNARFKALEGFKSGETTVLVATDIASRGIDVDDITHVVNYDMPLDPETYVHRIGRTARAGASGVAMSFCGKSERPKLQAIERQTKAKLSRVDDLPHIETAASDGDGGGGGRSHSSKPKSRKSVRTDDRTSSAPSKRRTSGKSANKSKDKPVASEGQSSQVKRKPKRKKPASKGGWNAPPSERTASGKAGAGKRKKSKAKGKWKDANEDRQTAASSSKKKRKKTSSARKWTPSSDGGQGSSGPSKGKKKKSKMGKAKWKAKAATAGRKGKSGKAQKKKNTSATPGHRGSPGYSKKTAGKRKSNESRS